MTESRSAAYVPPLAWERYVEILRDPDTDAEAWDACANTMRLAHGLPVCGHGLTYDFLIAQRTVAAHRNRWER